MCKFQVLLPATTCARTTSNYQADGGISKQCAQFHDHNEIYLHCEPQSVTERVIGIGVVTMLVLPHKPRCDGTFDDTDNSQKTEKD